MRLEVQFKKRCMRSYAYLVWNYWFHDQPSQRNGRALFESCTSGLEQEECARSDDIHGSGICMDLCHRIQLSSHVSNDGCAGRDMLRVRNMGKRNGQSHPLRLEFRIFLRRHTVDLYRLLLANSGYHSSPGKGNGGP